MRVEQDDWGHCWGLCVDHMSHSLNSLKGDYIGGNIGDYDRGY